MRRYVIGTAGHVDHGKTTLVRALTGVDTDRLPEEKRRGISIELGFAPLDLGGGMHASVVDVPGHRRLVRAMIAGASGIELVMLVVAADEGVMAQTREHVAVCELLGIRRAVLVVTKRDAVDADLASVARDEAATLLRGWNVEAVACSAKTGEGLEDVRQALRRALSELPAKRDAGPARLGIDRVFTVRGAGTVVTGTLISGSLTTGEALFVVGGKESLPTSARALHVHDAAVERAEAPTRLAVNLAGVALAQVRRGDVVTSDSHLQRTTLFDLLVVGEHALSRAAALTVHVGTASTGARVDAIDVSEGRAVVRMRLAEPTVIAGGDRVVLRGGVEGPAGAVAGGGIVVDARPDRRASGKKRRLLAAALASLDAGITVKALAEACAPRMLARAALGGRFAVDAASLDAAAERLVQAGAFARIEAEGWVTSVRLDALGARALSLVRSHHVDAPLERGLPLETLRARLSAGAGRLVAEEAIRRAMASTPEAIVIDGDVARTAQHGGRVSAEAKARLETVARAVGDASFAGVTEITLSQKTGLPNQRLRETLQKLARDGAALRLGELWLATEVVEEARRKMAAHFAGARALTVIEFKGLSGFSRKQAILVLEHFDRIGLTRREGDARVLR